MLDCTELSFLREIYVYERIPYPSLTSSAFGATYLISEIAPNGHKAYEMRGYCTPVIGWGRHGSQVKYIFKYILRLSSNSRT